MTQIDVLVVLNSASESSIPLEVVAATDAADVDFTVCSFFEPSSATFGIDIKWLRASSQTDPRAYLRLARIMNRLSPDIVHVHPNGTGAVVRLVSSVADSAIVTTEHNDHRSFGVAKSILNGSTNVFTDVLVANSVATRESLSRWEKALLRAAGVDTTVIHNGVDIARVESAVEESAPPALPDNFLIGTASRLVPQKNHRSLFRAAQPLLKDGLAELVLTGDGPLLDELKTLGLKLEIDDKVHYLGFLPERKDVYGVIDQLDVFAFPSHYEGFGVAVAEAMAMGTPVIANDIDVMREIVSDAGILVDATDIPTFSEAMYRLRENPDLRAQLGEAGRTRVRRSFRIEQTATEYVACYRALAK